jgi:plastocyanin
MSIALLTCTPPNFDDDLLPPTPTGGPLILFPLEPELVAGSAFTFMAAGGTPPYTYSVSGDGTINPSTGRYTAPELPSLDTVLVTDYEDDVVETNVVVHPSQLWVLPAGATIPADTDITFSGHGGTPPYTYLKVSGLGNIDSNGVYSSSTETDALIKVTDDADPPVEVTTHVYVQPPANPVIINPASAVIETNVALDFGASGGSGGYTFTKISGVGGMIDANTYRSSEAGSATVRVTDSAFHTADASVTVNAPPPPLTITPTSATVVVGGTQAFTAAGGTSPYTYSKVSGVGSINPSTGVYTSAVAGSAEVKVTDINSRTASAPITVTDALGITPSSTSVTVDGTVTLVASGGIPDYNWIVTGIGGSVSPGSGSTVVYTAPPDTGTATVTVHDGEDTADCIIDVTPGPLSISPTSITLQVGNTVTFIATGGDSYTFSVFSGVGSFPTGDGEYDAGSTEGTAIVRVTDNYLRTQDAAVTVNPPPLELSPSSITIQAGSSITFTGAGGTPDYTYSKVSGVGSINASTGLYTSPTQGSAVVKVTDRRTPTGRTATASVTVDPPPAPPLNLSPVSVNVETGNDQTFAASGGTTPYAWDVVQGAPGGTVTSGGVYTAPGTPGTYTVRVTDHDATVRTATVRVYAPLVIDPHPASINAGAQLDFNASGGISPLVFSMPPGGRGTIIPATGLYTAPGTAGTDSVRVSDSQGKYTDWSFTVMDPAVWNARQSIEASQQSGQYASLALDSTGVPQIAYWEAHNKDLRIARWNGSSWTLSTIDSNNGGDKYASLALDPGTGRARMAWYDSSSNELKYRAWNGSDWDSEQTVDSSSNDLGEYASLALDLSGSPRIAYYENDGDNLKYAWWDGSWHKETVDSAGLVGAYASLALDLSGNPHIAYYDATNSALKYAAWNGSWNIVTVDNGGTGTVGQYASLKLNGSGFPCIAYYDTTNDALKYAEWNGSSWDIVTVDSAGTVGQYASLALDPVDYHPHIAYYDASTGSGNLKYAARTGSIWLVGTVDAGPGTNNVGKYASLAIDPLTKAMKIAYYDETAKDLLFITEQP